MMMGTSRGIQGRSRLWRHPSVHALVDAVPGHADPEDAIRAAARALVEEARTLGWSGPPFNPSTLASLRGIAVAEGHAGMNHDALIQPYPGGALEILWNPELPESRRHYAISHEIAHTLFPDCYEMAHYRDKDRGRFDPDKEVEDLCEIAAAELLLPYPEFADDVRDEGVSLASLDVLRERYFASREAVAIRMMHTDVRPSAIVFATLRLKPTEERAASQARMSFAEAPEARLRVDMMTMAPSFAGDWIPRHKSIPQVSRVYELLQPDGPELVTASEVWSTGKKALPRSNIEAVSIPPDGEGRARVAVLMTPLSRRRR